MTIQSRNRRWLLALLELVMVLLVAGPALAAGRIEWKEKTLKERDDKSWRLEMAIYMPKAPDVPHVPMKFEFQPEVYYERDMMDGDKLVERKVPLENRQPLIESVDVGFLDSASGKIETRTRFTFKVTRAHGYEAGEYKVTGRDTRNGQIVGAATTLIFAGENEIIDRRAMVFEGKKKEKKDDKKAGADAPKDGEGSSGDKPKDDSAAPDKTDTAGGEPAADDAKAPGSEDSSESEDDKPAGEIKEKPGGCGCRIQDTHRQGAPALLLVLALGAGLVVRRRRAA
ncbi:MAG TPA: MYXO-CTERM sorting domain-containing protein [Polyangiaceae bacterium]|nr:MYXO-CTERM sorting domain-containing protein [Polyangiaceae bacterium]